MAETESVEQQLGRHKLVPVISLASADLAEPMADALVSGGLPVAEVTFRTEAAEEAIRVMAERGDLLVGAGTVLSAEQADRAQQAGARFAVSPGYSAEVVRRCRVIGLPIFPGVATPTDIEMALDNGLQTLKFFPAEAFGGVGTLKAISAPYTMVRFIPTGGINVKNLPDYLALPQVVACGGSWMVKPDLYADGSFDKVESAVREARDLVEQLG